MSVLTIVVIILAVLLFLAVIVGAIAVVDWRKFFIKRYGTNYKNGLAHIIKDGVSVYRDSSLLFVSDIAMTYVMNDGGALSDHIVPNKIGFTYDEYTGARLYRVAYGGTVAQSDEIGAPAVDFPSALISSHVLSATVHKLATSVNSDDAGFNIKPYVLAAVLVVAVVAVLFFTGVIKVPTGAAVPRTPPAQTQTTPPPVYFNDGEVK